MNFFIILVVMFFAPDVIALILAYRFYKKETKQPKVTWDDDTSGGFGDDIR